MMRVALRFMKYTAGTSTVYVGMNILYILMYCRFYVQIPNAILGNTRLELKTTVCYDQVTTYDPVYSE